MPTPVPIESLEDFSKLVHQQLELAVEDMKIIHEKVLSQTK